ncbi:MAG: glutathione synthase [Actinomycetota bacterium]
MDLLVIMDGPETVDPATDTSFALIQAATALGHRVFHCGATDVSLEDGRVHARAHRATPDPALAPALVLHERERLDLGALDAVLIRPDPPFDGAYLHLTLLLDFVSDETLIVNAPRALRDANEKLYACRFPELMPPTIVTSAIDALEEFVAAHGAIVLKPIDGHGGRGVTLVRRDGDRDALHALTANGDRVVMAQRYLPGVLDGDKRILLLDGEPLGAILRIPAPGDFRANIAVGGRTSRTTIDDADQRIIDRIAPSLRADGLVFVGIDVIEGHLSEVNVTSPTGIVQMAELDGTRPSERVIEWIERELA